MTKIRIERYNDPAGVAGWEGYIEPEDRAWILYFAADGQTRFYPHRERETGAVVDDEVGVIRAELAKCGLDYDEVANAGVDFIDGLLREHEQRTLECPHRDACEDTARQLAHARQQIASLRAEVARLITVAFPRAEDAGDNESWPLEAWHVIWQIACALEAPALAKDVEGLVRHANAVREACAKYRTERDRLEAALAETRGLDSGTDGGEAKAMASLGRELLKVLDDDGRDTEHPVKYLQECLRERREFQNRIDKIEPQWIVNDLAELGVLVGGRAFFLWKGCALEYDPPRHSDGSEMLWRPVQSREFGEVCHPVFGYPSGVFSPSNERYTKGEGWQPLAALNARGGNSEPAGDTDEGEVSS
jgi:hypothetical protein